MLKRTKLRHSEYYDMQNIYDTLYSNSLNGNNAYKLMNIIESEQNIRLAFRNIKTNKGSKTAGVDGLDITEIWHLNDSQIIEEVRKRLRVYKPQSVRRVHIPKEGSDKMRPLGIPTIWDRLIQQSILQVLEPICEAKFHKHSYGFRPNRNTHHALSRVISLMNIGNYNYCVDIDISGFFDNVSHGKLLKQMWNLGIRDKALLSIVSKILKSEIQGEGIPTKGTPQGGIISPLLSNIVLNELDWWVSNQWETYKPRNAKSKGFLNYAKKYTKLKPGYIVRYADDFKIMCRTYGEAKRFYYATIDFLNKRLGLEINKDKSKVVNLKKNSSSFLGFIIKSVKQGKSKFGYVAKTSMSKKAINKTKRVLKQRIKEIQHTPTADGVLRYNVTLIGIQNYYKYATKIYLNLTEISYALLKTIKARLKDKSRIIKFSETTDKFKKRAKGIKDYTRIYTIQDAPLLPITSMHHKYPLNFSQDTCNYTSEGREKIHSNLKAIPKRSLARIMMSYCRNRSIRYNDNKISRYIAQYGKCYITGNLIAENRVYCHTKISLVNGGTDEYKNLIIVDKDVGKLINAVSLNKINTILESLNLNYNQLRKLNNLRIIAGNKPINSN